MKDNWIKYLKKKLEALGFNVESEKIDLNKQAVERIHEQMMSSLNDMPSDINPVFGLIQKAPTQKQSVVFVPDGNIMLGYGVDNDIIAMLDSVEYGELT